MKNVMFILTKLGGPGWGGAHKVAVLLANYLAKKNYNVSIAVSENSEQDYPVEQSVTIYCLSNYYKSSQNRSVNLIRKLFSFRKLCSEKGIDVVVGFTSNMAVYAILTSIFSRRKSLISERTDPHIEPRSGVMRLMRNLMFCFADFVVFQTPGAQSYFPGVVRKKSTIIANPISSKLPEPFLGERERKVVDFCRIDPQKNLLLLIEAFDSFAETHKDYFLEIYGDAKENDPYKDKVVDAVNNAKHCDSIRLLPASKNIHNIVKNARMFVSSSDYEGLSNSMLEAMAIGLPIIVTDCKNGGERMCIQNNVNGIIVPLNDKNELCKAMERVADDNAFATYLSTNACEIRNRFSENRIFEQWSTIISNFN